jgi:hypothetical protein
MKNFFTLFVLLISSYALPAQLVLNGVGTAETIDFAGFEGTGFSPSPSTGQLNSNTWAVSGMSEGDLPFGGEITTGDFARGTTSGLVTTGGIYAVDILGDQALMVQPTSDDFTPGTITLKLENNTGTTITQLDIAYDIYVLNDQGRANSFLFSHSSDDVTYTPVPELDYTSPEAADFSPYSETMSYSITGLSIADGELFYIRWTGDDVSGSGSRDEFALDNIYVTPLITTGTPTYTISPTTLTVSEPSGVTYIDVTLSESTDCVLSVAYTEVTADLPTDFGFTTFTLTFTEGGPTTQTLDVGIVDDFEVEPTESFIVYFIVSSGDCVAGADDEIEIFIESNDLSGTGVVEITDEISADEGVGAIVGAVTVSEPVDCEVQLLLDGASTMEEGSDYSFTLPATITFSASGTTTQEFTIPIIDDLEVEPTEELIINISIASGSCVMGTSGDLDLFIADNDVAYTAVDIADVHAEDAEGISTNLGDLVSLTGIVYGVNLWDGGLQFTLRDNTGGISVFSFAETYGYTVNEGDAITVYGEIDQFNGLTEIIPDTIIFISSDNMLESATNVETLGEDTESELVSIDNLQIVDFAQWLGDGSSFNVEFTDGINTYTIRIDNNTEIATSPFPLDVAYATITGLGTQFDTNLPYTDGYQLMPRYLSDLIFFTPVQTTENVQLSVFPNPAASQVTMHSAEIIRSIEISNQLGVFFMRSAVSGIEHTIDVSSLPAGVYIIKAHSDAGLFTSQFIKQ